MDLRVNQMQALSGITKTSQAAQSDGAFKFTLVSQLEEAGLQERLTLMLEDITQQGERIKKRMDIRDVKRYRMMIQEFMNEVVSRSHEFSRENSLDRRGRHRVYGIVKLVNQAIDELAQELIEEEVDSLMILARIDEIRGMLLDIFM